MATTTAIKLDDVSKRFGDFTAVDDVSLNIKKGEFFSLLGPSGCGKTTTLRMVAGFEQPTEGQILLEGEAVEDVPPNERNVNTVFQSYALFEHLNVEDNVAFGLKRKKVEKNEIKRRVAEALELVSLEHRADARTTELSGGMQQRVALARALVNRPAVLLLDEPLGALDLKLRRQMQVELKDIQREVGITFVYVTHDQEEALAMSDRIAVMHEGRVVQCGEPEDIYEKPGEAFVAGFIGVSNLMEGIVDGEDKVKLASGQKVERPAAEGPRPRRDRAALGPAREDRPRRPRAGDGPHRRHGRAARLPGRKHPGDRLARRRRPRGRARAEHLPRQQRRPLGPGHQGQGRVAPRPLPRAAGEARPLTSERPRSGRD